MSTPELDDKDRDWSTEASLTINLLSKDLNVTEARLWQYLAEHFADLTKSIRPRPDVAQYVCQYTDQFRVAFMADEGGSRDAIRDRLCELRLEVDTLEQKILDLRIERNIAIYLATQFGIPQQDIAKLAGVKRQQVYRVMKDQHVIAEIRKREAGYSGTGADLIAPLNSDANTENESAPEQVNDTEQVEETASDTVETTV